MAIFGSKECYTVVTPTGSWQELAVFAPWCDDDIYVVGLSMITMSYPYNLPRSACFGLMGEVSEGALGSEVPKFNFALFGGDGGEIAPPPYVFPEPEYEFHMPEGYGFLMPGTKSIAAGTTQRNFKVKGQIQNTGQPGQAVILFTTLFFYKASDVPGMVEPKTKTLSGVSPVQVPFLIVQEPWESTPIRLLGVELALTLGYSVSMHVCNSAMPDIIKNVGWHKRTLSRWLPPSADIIFPAAGSASPPHIDCHIELDPLTDPNHAAFMVIYYTPVAPPPVATPVATP